MTAVQIKITTTEYQDATFGWYEVFGDQTALSLGAVISTASFQEIAFSNSFIHANLVAGDTWYYWIRPAYIDRTSGAISYGTLISLGSILLVGSAAGFIVGPGVAVDSDFVLFDGTTGALAKDGGLSLSTDGTFAANSDAKIPSEKATKTYVAAQDAATLASAHAYADTGDAAAIVTAAAYTDLVANGRSWKNAVRAGTTVAGTLATSFENGDTIDGVVLATGDRILIKNQVAQAENGIYVVAASGAPARAADGDSGAELVDASVYVAEGTTLADLQWTQTTNAPIVLGVSNLVWVQSGAGSTYTADGVTLDLTGTVFSVKAGGIGTTELANDAVTLAKLVNASAQYKILARKTAGAGDWEECSLSEVLDFVTSAAWGDILFRGTAGWVRLSAGTAGWFLQTGGAGADPAWAAGGGGYSDEQAQDAIGAILVGLTYNDATPTIAVKRTAQIQVSDPAGVAITTGDGKAYFRVGAELNGYNLSAVAAALTTVSSSGIPTFQIANVTDGVDMLSTKLTIDATETDSGTATAPAVIDATKDDVATGDMLRIDCDVSGTGAKGLIVELTFSLP